MVSLYINNKYYENDIAEMIRAYLGFTELQPVDSFDGQAGYALEVLLYPEGKFRVDVRGKTRDGRAASYSWPIREESDALLRKREERRAAKIAVFRCMRALEPEIVLPWGSLTGIRPTKLLRELEEAMGEQQALRIFLEEFDVRQDKALLAQRIVEVQRPLLESAKERDIDVYIGIPYCKSRCLYCSFASEVVDKNGVPEQYLHALHKDIALGAAIAREGGYTLRCMYVGGGTPTVLTAEQFKWILGHAMQSYGACAELTVEAGRPDTLDAVKLRAMKEMGVTRISLNPQSMQPETMRRIGRAHTPEDILKAYALAQDIGFGNINMDIIAGLPSETSSDFADTLTKLAELRPANLTVHTLAVKRSSRLKERLEEHPLPTPEEAACMVAMGESCACGMGMQPYYMYRQKYMRGNLENVGYALPGKACMYNIDMMEEAVSIMAHGAGAMTKRVFPGRNMRVERIPAPKDIQTYCGKLEKLHQDKRALFLADGRKRDKV